jgi:hypothetical protein
MTVKKGRLFSGLALFVGFQTLPGNASNDQIGDGVDANDVPFLGSFLYIASPHAGYDVP